MQVFQMSKNIQSLNVWKRSNLLLTKVGGHSGEHLAQGCSSTLNRLSAARSTQKTIKGQYFQVHVKQSARLVSSVILLYGWLNQRARWTESCAVIGYPSMQDGAILPAQDHTPCPVRNFFQKPNNKSFIDQAFSVKMAGYWPRSFLRVYGPWLRLSP